LAEPQRDIPGWSLLIRYARHWQALSIHSGDWPAAQGSLVSMALDIVIGAIALVLLGMWAFFRL
jgi:hypothetical protein